MSEETVLFLTTSDVRNPKTGADVRTAHLRTAVAEEFQIATIYYRKSTDPDGRENSRAIPYPPTSLFVLADPRYFLALVEELRNRTFDAVVVSAIGAGFYGLLVHLLLGVPLVFDDHNVEHQLSYDQKNWPRYVTVYVLEYFLCRFSALVVVPSESDRDALSQWSRGKIAVVANGFNRSSFGLDGPSHSFEDETVLFFGNFRYAPNVEAARYIEDTLGPDLLEQRPQTHVKLVGPASDRFESRMEALSNVEVSGFVDDIAAYIRGSDVVIVPLQTGSGTRLKIIEALACGTPVVSTPKGAEGWPNTWNNLHVADLDAFPTVTRQVLRTGRFDQAEYDEYVRYSWRAQGERFSAAIADLLVEQP